MGEPIFGTYFSARKKQAIWDSRVVGTRNLSVALKAKNVNLKFYSGASAIGIYDFGSGERTEDTPAGSHWLAKLCAAWEEQHNSIPAQRHSSIRIGLVLSHDADMIRKILTSALSLIIPRFGSGKQVMSWIHLHDLVNVFSAAAKGELSGPVNAVHTDHVTGFEFNDTIRGFFSRPILSLPVPNALIKAVAGAPASVIIESQTVIPAKLNKAGFDFKYRNLHSALRDALGVAPHPITRREEPCFTYEVFQHIPQSPSSIWPFFCDPYNLEKITPNSLNFKITRVSDETVQRGFENRISTEATRGSFQVEDEYRGIYRRILLRRHSTKGPVPNLAPQTHVYRDNNRYHDAG